MTSFSNVYPFVDLKSSNDDDNNNDDNDINSFMSKLSQKSKSQFVKN